MNEQDDARLWHQEVSHLVQAHGASPGRLSGLAHTLGQYRWVHFDTHAALDIAQMRPPDGHVHAELPDPGRPGQSPSCYRPFGSSPAGALSLPSTELPRFVAMTRHTGLPQTGMLASADLEDVTACWPSVALGQLRAHFDAEPDPEQALAGFLDDLRQFSDPHAAQRLEDISCAAVTREVLRQVSLTNARVSIRRGPGEQHVRDRARGR